MAIKRVAFVNTRKCTGCRACLRVCPVKAIRIARRKARVDARRCIGCGACQKVCPRGAITLRRVVVPAPKPSKLPPWIRPARHWKSAGSKSVRCLLCPWKCLLPEGSIGRCRVRKNIGGRLYTLVYGKLAAAHVDPIEKKPMLHFLPRTLAFSVATAGCNLRCLYCQNWAISQRGPTEEDFYMSPARTVELAKKYRCKVIAFTYTEPVVFYEYMLDTAKLAKKHGLKTVMITGGYINPTPLKELLPFLDAVKVDFKGINPKFYRKVVGGKVEHVLEAMRIVRRSGTWLELVNLIIPGGNDNSADVKRLCLWVKKNLGDYTPISFTRFFPMYRMRHLPPTPVSTLEKCYRIAKSVGLKFPYVGNVPGHKWEDTYCPKCGRKVIDRYGVYPSRAVRLRGGRCAFCGAKIPGVWK